MQENTWIIWLVLMIAALVLESLSMQLFSIWFALGAAAALLACVFNAPLWVQIPLFVVVTVISLIATRPLVRRLQKDRKPTNADRNLGKIAVVLEDIDNLNSTGQVRVEGQIWSARAEEDGIIFAAGQNVETVAIKGNKVIVKALPDALPEE